MSFGAFSHIMSLIVPSVILSLFSRSRNFISHVLEILDIVSVLFFLLLLFTLWILVLPS